MPAEVCFFFKTSAYILITNLEGHLFVGAKKKPFITARGPPCIDRNSVKSNIAENQKWTNSSGEIMKQHPQLGFQTPRSSEKDPHDSLLQV